MRIAHLDCLSGIAGDMTLAALFDSGVDPAAVQAAVDTLGLPGVKLVVTEVKRRGFRALHVRVEHPPQKAHRHVHQIAALIDAATGLSPRQRDLAKRIFTKLGEAEARVHGQTIRQVHFHEVGAVDSIVDIVGAAVAWDLLGVDRITCSPIPVGTGSIQIDHGRVTVPAPATAELLRGIPLAESSVHGELTTPTGAAIAASLVDRFGPLPAMRIEHVGYGAGTKDFAEQANLLRLFVGTADSALARDEVHVLETNLDDTSGEVIGHATAKLLEAGALDVYTTAVQMKKGRPGVLISVLARPLDAAKLEKILFRETGTLGVRRWTAARHKLERRPFEVVTAHGPVAGKLAWIAGQPPAFSPEYEACRVVAERTGEPLRAIHDAALRAFDTLAAADPARLAALVAGAAPPPTDAPTPATHDHSHDHGHDHDHDHGGHDHHH